MAQVSEKIGAARRPPKAHGTDLEADPDLPRWQDDRWAPHSFDPVVGKSRHHARGDGSFHDRSLAAGEAEG